MCLGSTPAPAVQPLPPPAPVAPKKADEAVRNAGVANKKRAALASGRNSTVLTSAQGLDSATSTAKTQLGV